MDKLLHKAKEVVSGATGTHEQQGEVKYPHGKFSPPPPDPGKPTPSVFEDPYRGNAGHQDRGPMAAAEPSEGSPGDSRRDYRAPQRQGMGGGDQTYDYSDEGQGFAGHGGRKGLVRDESSMKEDSRRMGAGESIRDVRGSEYGGGDLGGGGEYETTGARRAYENWGQGQGGGVAVEHAAPGYSPQPKVTTMRYGAGVHGGAIGSPGVEYVGGGLGAGGMYGAEQYQHTEPTMGNFEYSPQRQYQGQYQQQYHQQQQQYPPIFPQGAQPFQQAQFDPSSQPGGNYSGAIKYASNHLAGLPPDDPSGGMKMKTSPASQSVWTSLFNNALSHLSSVPPSNAASGLVDEKMLIDSHRAAYFPEGTTTSRGTAMGAGGGQRLDSQKLAAAAAMQALKIITRSGSSTTADGAAVESGGVDLNAFVGLAMAECVKLFDRESQRGFEGSGTAGLDPDTSRQDAVSKAAAMAFKLFMKSQADAAAAGGGPGMAANMLMRMAGSYLNV